MTVAPARDPLMRRLWAWLGDLRQVLRDARSEIVLGFEARAELLAVRSTLYQLGWHVEGGDLADDIRSLALAWNDAENRAGKAVHDLAKAQEAKADRPGVLLVRLEWHLLEHGLWCDACLLPGRYRIALVERATLARWQTVSACDGCGARTVEP